MGKLLAEWVWECRGFLRKEILSPYCKLSYSGPVGNFIDKGFNFSNIVDMGMVCQLL